MKLPRRRASAAACPVSDDAGVGAPRSDWFALCIGGWTVMLGALAASAPLIADRVFILKIGGLIVLALPVAYYVQYSRVNRWTVNWLAFYSAILLGAVEAITWWPHEEYRAFQNLHVSFAILVRGFLWVIAFRAFAIRSLTDQVLTIIPAVSCVMLALIPEPTVLSGAGTVAIIIGALYLLAAEHRDEARPGSEVQVLQQSWLGNAPRRAASVNSWQAIALVVLVVALVVGAGASYFEFSGGLGRDIQIVLAQYLAGYFMAERSDFAPEPVLYLSWGSPPVGDRVVMVVQCERGENWRQQAYAEYTGWGWRPLHSRKDNARATRDGTHWRVNRSRVSGQMARGAIAVKQVYHLRVSVGGVLPALFVADDVRGLRLRGLYMGETGALNCSGYLRSGATYEVTSLIPPGNAAGRIGTPPLSRDLERRYLQLPPQLPQRVRDLARQITRGTRGPQDAAVTIRSYLVDHYPYNLRVAQPSWDQDFVDWFLFEAKQGYCNHFASAMVVLCRCVGVPARLVTGYVPGELSPEQADTYEVQEKDAHSWVEVFIGGLGWQTLDPTPPQSEHDRKASLAAALKGLATALRARAVATWAYLTAHVAAAVAWLLALAAMAVGLRAWQRGAVTRVRLRRRNATPTDRTVFAYRRMLHWLGRVGQARTPSQAPLEYLALLPESLAPVLPHARAITASYLRARYARSGAQDQDAAAAEAALEAMAQALFRK